MKTETDPNVRVAVITAFEEALPAVTSYPIEHKQQIATFAVLTLFNQLKKEGLQEGFFFFEF
jgi:hypothetical protein